MLTVTYAAAALRISRLGALAQRQSAIEAISRIDTFLTDKTGTLTTQRIAFGAIEPIGAARGRAGARRRRRGDRGEHERAEQHDRRASGRVRRAMPGRSSAEVPFSSALRWSAIRFEAGDGAHPTDGGHVRARRGGRPRAVDERAPATDVLARAAELASAGQRVLVVARGSSVAAPRRRRRRHASGTARAARAPDVPRGAAAGGPGHGRRPARPRYRREDRVGRRPQHGRGDRPPARDRDRRGCRLRPRPRRPRRRRPRRRRRPHDDLRPRGSAPEGASGDGR